MTDPGEPIVLVGASGSGTSTVGRLLAASLGREHLDVDRVIEQRAGKTVAEIFIEDGEPAFRAIEESTTIELLDDRSIPTSSPPTNPPTSFLPTTPPTSSPSVTPPTVPVVLSLGSGAVLSPAVRAALKGRQVIWLQVSAGSAAERTGLNAARPATFGNVRGRLIQLLNQRAPLYAEVATSSISTDDRTADEVAGLVLEGVS